MGRFSHNNSKIAEPLDVMISDNRAAARATTPGALVRSCLSTTSTSPTLAGGCRRHLEHHCSAGYLIEQHPRPEIKFMTARNRSRSTVRHNPAQQAVTILQSAFSSFRVRRLLDSMIVRARLALSDATNNSGMSSACSNPEKTERIFDENVFCRAIESLAVGRRQFLQLHSDWIWVSSDNDGPTFSMIPPIFRSLGGPQSSPIAV